MFGLHCRRRTSTAVQDYSALIEKAHAAGVLVAVASDLLALTLLTPPGSRARTWCWGARSGLACRWGMAARMRRFATREMRAAGAGAHHWRVGGCAGQSRVSHVAADARAAHPARKATSNICTAQALLANIAGLYAVYHGPDGLKAIASRVHARGASRAWARALGFAQANAHYFDTLFVDARIGDGRSRPCGGRRGAHQSSLRRRPCRHRARRDGDDRRRWAAIVGCSRRRRGRRLPGRERREG